ncbi:iron ABC transporter permease [Rhodovulum sp. BSW8]|uniref:FecCD family ABC transporter permease n=1 Tax=Rhodovulum sp. BSW8 TaxID=2259645 RepID=UPI000DE3DA96|nr:iron ABC transporter permease [Rhodovulum sp. BSW8]RBO52379.1 iron ABC transporter permease [Rhodovulum sp. BSW8]
MRPARAADGRPVLRLASGLEIRRGNLLAGLGLVLAVLALGLISLGVGATRTGPAELIGTLLGTGSGDGAFAILEVRLPRIALGFLAGWCVALVGAALQSLARNPLADPGLLGLSQGSMAAIVLMLVFLPAAPLGLIPLAAIGGGLAVAGLLIALVGGARAGGMAILLMGIAVETVLSSLTAILILYAPPETSYALSDWLAGSLFQASWGAIAALGPWVALSLPAIAILGRPLRVLDLGDEMAMSLGDPVLRSRPAILLAAVVLTSAAVTAVGPLSFLGVMAPHLAGALTRSTGRARLVLSGLMGGLLVVAADTLSRGVGGGIALPIGLSLTMIGVPLFILTLRLRLLAAMRTD